MQNYLSTGVEVDTLSITIIFMKYDRNSQKSS